MMDVSAPFSELSPASLIVQSSRFSPTEGKLASHCLREACLTGESLESHPAVRRSKGRFSWNRWKCGCRSRSRCLGSVIGMSDRSSSRPGKTNLFEAKRGRSEWDRSCERLSVREELSWWWLWEGRHMPGGCPKAGGMHLLPLPWVPTLEQRTLGASLLARSRIGLWSPATGGEDPWKNWGSSVISMDSTHRRISLASRNRNWDLVPPDRLR